VQYKGRGVVSASTFKLVNARARQIAGGHLAKVASQVRAVFSPAIAFFTIEVIQCTIEDAGTRSLKKRKNIGVRPRFAVNVISGWLTTSARDSFSGAHFPSGANQPIASGGKIPPRHKVSSVDDPLSSATYPQSTGVQSSGDVGVGSTVSLASQSG